MRRVVAFVVMLVLSFASALYAQSTNASLTGYITDPSKAIIVDAKVIVINVGTNTRHEGVTDKAGSYAFTNLPPGVYRIEVEKPGFKTVVKSDVILHVQDTIAINFEMVLGSGSEIVTVQGGAPLINTQDAAVSTVVDRQFVENLPLNGRSFHALLELTPGVVLTPTQDQGEQGQFSINGNRADANYFSIDGASANFGTSSSPIWGQNAAGALPALSAMGGTNNLVSVDALQEFRIETSNFAPEFGRGGAQVILATRSGNNAFHGIAFDYLRNDVFDANDWFGNSRGLPRPAERQNDFGGVFGGRILKDKTFFFFSYEGLRLRQPKAAITDVPSLQARQNAAPAAQPFLNAFPLPNGPVTLVDPKTGAVLANEYAASYSDPSTLNATSIRIDQVLSSKVTLFGRYNYAPSRADQRNLAGAESVATHAITEIDTQTATVGVTASLSSRAISDSRFNYSKSTGSITFHDDTMGGAVPPPDSVMFPPGLGSSANSDGGLFIAGLRSGQFESGVSAKNNQEIQLNLVETLSYLRGPHQWKFGFDFRRLSAVPGFRKFDVFAVNFSIQTLLKGVTDLWILESNAIQPHLRFYNYSAFGQDTWKVSPRLTLTYGIRWEHAAPPTETTGNPPFAVTQVTDPSAMQLEPRGTALWKTSWANFAPRFGVSYMLNGSAQHPLVIRGGAGLFYSLGTETAGGVAAARRWPYSASIFPTNVPLPLTLPPPDFNAIFTPPFGLTSLFDPNLKVPYSGQWNVAVEQGVGSNQKFSASYIGSVGRRLLRQEGLNSAHLPVNPIFTSFYLTKNESYSNYDALQLQYQRHLSHGLQALISYTWAHSLDNASSDQPYGVGNDTSGLLPSSFYDVHNDYGASNFDIRHAFNAALTYDLPGKGLKIAALRRIVGGWSVDGIVRARSAPPLTVVYGPSPTSKTKFFDPQFGSPMYFRPDVVPGQSIYLNDPTAPGGKRLNIDAFSIPPNQDRQGNLGRNTIRAFGAVQSDLSLRRQFNFGEKFKLVFRTDAFNIFNHPNFGYPGSLLGTPGLFRQPGFGEAQATLANTLGQGGAFGGGFNPLYAIGGPRSLQLSLKLQF